MPGQTTFSLNPAQALEGMIADLGSPQDVISRALSDAAGIGAGRVVKNGTTIGTHCAALTVTGFVPIGVTILDLCREPKTPRFLQNDDIGLMRRGYIWMTCIDDMRAVTGAVYICFSGANAGLPQASSVGADLVQAIHCMVGGNTGALGKFSINLP